MIITLAIQFFFFSDFERIKEGIGDKVALAIQYTSQFFGGFIIAFFYDWRLTLIMMSLMPLIACAGAFVGRVSFIYVLIDLNLWVSFITRLHQKLIIFHNQYSCDKIFNL